MKEEYVTYGQAVKLKELGFDWVCRDFYPITGALGIKRNCSHANFNSFEMSFDSKYGEIFSAPRLNQAHAWLREIKGIDIEPRVWLVGGKREYRPYVMPPKCKDYIACPPEKSYEKALSAGIDEALVILTNKQTDK
ncbi:MAG: hypothetical protein HDS04_09015 [Bacteroides sp.]|nr:hypothetical protein [Bacteroides sp.]